MNNFKLIYRILKFLERAMDCGELDTTDIQPEQLGITRERWFALLEMLADEGYITGVAIRRSADGISSVGFSGLRITLKGLEYLEENSMMAKASKAIKGVIDVIK